MRRLVATLALAVVSAATAAAAHTDIIFSKDRRTVRATHRDPHFIPPAINWKLKLIAGNMGFAYPKGLYFCCFGATVEGPEVFGGQEWSAVAFTPAKDATVKEIDAGLTYIDGRNDIVLSLAADDSSLPGAILASDHAKKLGTFSTCCQLVIVAAKNVKISAGTQYWVIASTDVGYQHHGPDRHHSSGHQCGQWLAAVRHNAACTGFRGAGKITLRSSQVARARPACPASARTDALRARCQG